MFITVTWVTVFFLSRYCYRNGHFTLKNKVVICHGKYHCISMYKHESRKINKWSLWVKLGCNVADMWPEGTEFGQRSTKIYHARLLHKIQTWKCGCKTLVFWWNRTSTKFTTQLKYWKMKLNWNTFWRGLNKPIAQRKT